jgi:hypothetical protein
MTPAGAIAGRVTGENGEPISRAQVQALKYSYDETGNRTLNPVQVVLTDDLGEYRLFWLTPGRYYVMASPTDPKAASIPVLSPSIDGSSNITTVLNGLVISGTVASLTRGAVFATAGVSGGAVTNRTLTDGTTIEEAFVPVYFPGVIDERAAMPVDVGAGATAGGVDVSVRRTRVYRIRGLFAGATAGAPPSLRLVPQHAPSAGGYVPAVLRQGTFEINGVAPGSYFLTGQFDSGFLPIEVSDSDVNGIVIPAPSAFPISGRVSMDGQAKPGAPLTVQLTSQPPVSRNVTASIQPDGSFAVALTPGDYRVRVNNSYYLKAIRFSGADGQSGILHITGAENSVLDLVVAKDTGSVEGVAVNERRSPQSNVRVVLVPDAILRGQTSLYQTARTDAEGRFHMESVAPGAYKVFAWEDVEDRAWLNAEFMNAYEDRGRLVNVGPERKETIEVTVIPFQR